MGFGSTVHDKFQIIFLLRLLIRLLSSTTGTLFNASLSWTGTLDRSVDLIISFMRVLYMRLLISGLGGGKGGIGARKCSLFTYSFTGEQRKCLAGELPKPTLRSTSVNNILDSTAKTPLPPVYVPCSTRACGASSPVLLR